MPQSNNGCHEELYSLDDEIWICQFDDETARRFRAQVMHQSKTDPNAPIVIYINSYGGSADALACMVDTLEEVPNAVITVCMGKAMSAGAILLSLGDMRFCAPNSRIMVHELQIGTTGNVHDVNGDANESLRLNEYWLGRLAAKCHIKGGYAGLRAMMKSFDARDIYLSAEDAKKMGIVDHVGVPHVEMQTRHKICTNTIVKKIMKEKEVSDGITKTRSRKE